MTAALIPGVIELAAHFQVGEDINASVKLHYETAATGLTQAQLDAVAAAAAGSFKAATGGAAHSSVKLLETTATDLSSAVGLQGLDTSTQSGGRSGHALPASACLLVNYKIARRYRGGKPRSYFPFMVAEDLADNQKWNPDNLGTTVAMPGKYVQDMFTSLAALSASGVTFTQQVNISRYSGSTWVGPATNGSYKRVADKRITPILDTIVGYSLNQRIGSQRRRLQF